MAPGSLTRSGSARHLSRHRQFHQLEQRRRDVGQAAAGAQFGLAGGKPSPTTNTST